MLFKFSVEDDHLFLPNTFLSIFCYFTSTFSHCFHQTFNHELSITKNLLIKTTQEQPEKFLKSLHMNCNGHVYTKECDSHNRQQ